MSEMFFQATAFNQNIGSWNVSSVTNMSSMFDGATAFNQDISGWDVSSVTNMSAMFFQATAFNQNISTWNVSQVRLTAYMFEEATMFNSDISAWNVSSVEDMSRMFREATAFNQDISGWDVSSVEDMRRMFFGASTFDQNIGSWDVSDVEKMSEMFSGASAFDQNIGSWDVSGVTDMSKMFENAVAFNQDISGWDVRNVTNMSSMLEGAVAFSAANYNRLLVGWAALTPHVRDDIVITVDAQYCNGIPADARGVLTGPRNWSITDNGAKNCIDASLSGLQVLTSDGDELDPAFDSNVIAYTLSVDSEVDMLTVSATPAAAEATPAYLRNDADAGDGSSIALDVGETRVKVVVTAGDGMTTQTYTITVTREAPNVDATLSGLTVSTSDRTDLSDELDPAFDPDVFGYTLSVEHRVSSLSVSVVKPTESTVSYARNDTTITSLTDLPLDVGSTTIAVIVTSGDGSTTETYRITVTRAAVSTDVALSSLSVSEGRRLRPDFLVSRIEYTVSVSHDVQVLDVSATAKDSNATLSYLRNDAAIENGAGIALDVGKTIIKVIVTAEDMSTTQTYRITVTRAAVSTDVALSSLSVSEGRRLRPDFLVSRIEYTVSVSHDVQVLDVSATAKDSNATLSYLRNDAAIENGAGIALDVGKTIIKVIVTAEDMSTTQTYTITVTRVSDSSDISYGFYFGLTEPAPEFVSLYPNPVEDVLTIEWVSTTYQGTQVYFYNLSGDLLLYRSVSLGPGRHRISIDLSAENIRPGLYMLKLKTAKHTHYRRILKR